jgi:hypothetical protein
MPSHIGSGDHVAPVGRTAFAPELEQSLVGVPFLICVDDVDLDGICGHDKY